MRLVILNIVARKSLYLEKRDGILDVVTGLSSTTKHPSLREISNVTGVSVGTLHSYLLKMQEEGLVTWNPRHHRSLTVLPVIQVGAPAKVASTLLSQP